MKIFALILPFCASVAQADCPSPDALAQGGIYVSFETGNFTHYRQGDSGLIIEDEYTKPFGATYRIFSHHGVYVTKESSLLPSGEASKIDLVLIEYAVPVTELPLPVAGLDWSGIARSVAPDSPFSNASGATRQEMQVSVKAQMVLNLEGCALRVLPFTIHYEWPENGDIRVHAGYYLPDYGMTIARVDPTGPVTATAISNKRPAG